jgi:hypothetical protein
LGEERTGRERAGLKKKEGRKEEEKDQMKMVQRMSEGVEWW